MYTRSQIPLRSIRLRFIEDRQPKHTRVLTVAGGVDLSFLDSTPIESCRPRFNAIVYETSKMTGENCRNAKMIKEAQTYPSGKGWAQVLNIKELGLTLSLIHI